MLGLGALSFLNPWLLAGILALPVLWWVLRAIPPSPQTQSFAGVRLLLGLEDEERQTHRTPWWLLLLRTLAIGAALLGFAQPVLNLTERIAPGEGRLLVLMDQGWASAPDWDERRATAEALLQEAADRGREVVFLRGASGDEIRTGTAEAALDVLRGTLPRPWSPDPLATLEALQEANLAFDDSVWVHDGLAREGTADLLGYLAEQGSLRLITSAEPPQGLTPPRLVDGKLETDVLGAVDPSGTQVIAMAEADAGGERRIAVAQSGPAEDGRATAVFDLPSELLSTVTRVVLADGASAGGSALADGAIRRVAAGIVSEREDSSITTLTSPVHYVEKALQPWADISQAGLTTVLDGEPTMVVLPDLGDLSPEGRENLTTWVESGGVLLRFAGPRLAASIGAQGFGSVQADDPLLPVRLRRGGRVLGGALAWSTPRSLGPFAADSPFRGLTSPEEVSVRTQVLAEPSPDLAGKVWASLDDGTPLVTAKPLGDGYVILFHVSSDAEWSSLPLSGLFVEMLGRVVTLASGRALGTPDAEELDGTLWRAQILMGVDGTPRPATDATEPLPGPALLDGAGAGVPPGAYIRADQGGRRTGAGNSMVLNLMTEDTRLTAFPDAPAGAVEETLNGQEAQRFGPWLLALALLCVVLDVIGTLIVSGRLTSGTKIAPLALALCLLAPALTPSPAQAQGEDIGLAIESTAETTLGFVRTGDPRLDRISERAMVGLGNALARRTAIEPGPPGGARPGSDELSFYPVLYWPLTSDTLPDQAGLDALAAYLRGGGMLIIDTQNGSSGFGGASAVQMREIARALNLPPLAPVDQDHVLTRAFYLLNDFPGRWRGGRVWTEAARQLGEDGEPAEDIPQFDRVDDNVSPVIVGSADWASAWAVDQRGAPLYPIGRPGDRQRELALRFGVNAVMYALTGNYKSDQVHAPAVLQRLGQ
ncbi:MAG: DUF4159 domain-containing protein [Paracoccaceae bacterium]